MIIMTYILKCSIVTFSELIRYDYGIKEDDRATEDDTVDRWMGRGLPMNYAAP